MNKVEVEVLQCALSRYSLGQSGQDTATRARLILLWHIFNALEDEQQCTALVPLMEWAGCSDPS
jgi:hypothetical protein